MNVADFVANFKDGARPSRFRVEMNIPAFAGGSDERDVYYIQAAALPQTTLGEVNVFYHGRQIKLAGDRTFEPWNVTVMNSVDFNLRDKMERWSNAINSFQGNVSLSGQDLQQYSSNASVFQLDLEDNVIKTYRFQYMFPTNVGEITLDWSTTDDIERFDVTFAYTYFESNTTT